MKLFIYCAGGFGREILDVARNVNTCSRRWSDVAFIDDSNDLQRLSINGAAVYTFKEVSESFDSNEFEVLIGHGEPAIRKLLMEKVVQHSFKMGRLIDNTCFISPFATIGEGAIITPYCSVAVDARLGRNVALNTKCIVGHDIQIGDNTVISSMVNIGGACIVGSESYIGMGAQIKEGLKIGHEVIIGMGSVVHHDIPDGMIAMGNPARPIRRNEDKRVFGKK